MLNPIPNISTSVPKECSTPSAHMVCLIIRLSYLTKKGSGGPGTKLRLIVLTLRQILQWQEMGILHEEFYPAHLDNLLTLCLNCEVIYMGVYPSYVVLPEDLDPFIQFETMDYAAREIAAKKGVEQKRSLPAVRDELTFSIHFPTDPLPTFPRHRSRPTEPFANRTSSTRSSRIRIILLTGVHSQNDTLAGLKRLFSEH